MAEPKPALEVGTFLGINLADKEWRLPLEKSGNLRNCFGNGQYVQKRPGQKFLEEIVSGTDIRDVYNFCEAKSLGPHALFILMKHRGTAIGPNLTDHWAYYDLETNTMNYKSQLRPGLAVNADNRNYGVVLEAARAVGAAKPLYVATSVGWIGPDGLGPYTYEVEDFGGGEPLPGWWQTFPKIAHAQFFNQHLFAAERNVNDVPFSQVDRPDIQATVDDKLPIYPESDIKAIVGARKNIDGMYVFKANSIHRITGEARELFARLPVADDIGGMRQEAFANVYGAVVGFAGRRGPGDAMDPDDVIMLTGNEVKRIGGDIRPALQAVATKQENESRAAFWRNMELVLMVPRVDFQTFDTLPPGDMDMFAYHVKSASWWRWTVNSGRQFCSIASVPMTINGVRREVIVLGSREGAVLRYFDEESPNDDGQDFESYYDFPWMKYGRGEEHTHEEITVEGDQKTGSPITVAIATGRDDGTMRDVGEVDLSEGYGIVKPPSDLGASTWTKVRIKFTTDGVQQRFTNVGSSRKGRGRMKETLAP